jgi:hypothetical protein
VCPPFFSYHLAIRAELEALGWSVTWWSDRASEFFGYKLAMRLLPGVVSTISERTYLAKLVGTEEFDRVLVIKGEALSPAVIRAIREHSPNAPMHMYLWDGVANVRNAKRNAPHFETVATFDPTDADRYGWRYRPLFASTSVPLGTEPNPVHDWAFVGTLHSDRHRVLHRIRRHNPGLRGFVRAFVPGRPLLLARRLTDWSLLFAPEGTVGTTPMGLPEVRAVLARSRAVVDIEHPKQRGLTMRSIEVLLGGKKLITTNRHIESADLYHPSRVCIVARDRPIVPPEFFAAPFEPISDATTARYRLATWLRDVLASSDQVLHEPVRSGLALG